MLMQWPNSGGNMRITLDELIDKLVDMRVKIGRGDRGVVTQSGSGEQGEVVLIKHRTNAGGVPRIVIQSAGERRG